LQELRHHSFQGEGVGLSARRERHLQGSADSWPTIRALTALLCASLALMAWPAMVAPNVSSASAFFAVPAMPKLQPDTLAAFERYVRFTEERNDAELKGGTGLLWIDSLGDAERQKAYASLKSGEVQVERLTTRDSGKTIDCPGGMIHHWVGLVFIPGVKLDNVLDLLEDYNHQSTYYAPDVERSKILSRDGEHFRVFLRFRRHKVITVVLDSEHDVHYFRDSAVRAHSRSSATRISEVENPGKADEREKTPGDDGGFLWRMETWWRMEERDGGVYVQSEVVSLTRDIPTGLGWMIGPFVTSIPKETLAFTLTATRNAVESRAKP
jgi:hypothetical protein